MDFHRPHAPEHGGYRLELRDEKTGLTDVLDAGRRVAVVRRQDRGLYLAYSVTILAPGGQVRAMYHGSPTRGDAVKLVREYQDEHGDPATW